MSNKFNTNITKRRSKKFKIAIIGASTVLSLAVGGLSYLVFNAVNNEEAVRLPTQGVKVSQPNLLLEGEKAGETTDIVNDFLNTDNNQANTPTNPQTPSPSDVNEVLDKVNGVTDTPTDSSSETLDPSEYIIKYSLSDNVLYKTNGLAGNKRELVDVSINYIQRAKLKLNTLFNVKSSSFRGNNDFRELIDVSDDYFPKTLMTPGRIYELNTKINIVDDVTADYFPKSSVVDGKVYTSNGLTGPDKALVEISSNYVGKDTLTPGTVYTVDVSVKDGVETRTLKDSTSDYIDKSTVSTTRLYSFDADKNPVDSTKLLISKLSLKPNTYYKLSDASKPEDAQLVEQKAGEVVALSNLNTQKLYTVVEGASNTRTLMDVTSTYVLESNNIPKWKVARDYQKRSEIGEFWIAKSLLDVGGLYEVQPNKDLVLKTSSYVAKSAIDPNFVYTLENNKLVKKGSLAGVIDPTVLATQYVRTTELAPNTLWLKGPTSNNGLTDVTNSYVKTDTFTNGNVYTKNSDGQIVDVTEFYIRRSSLTPNTIYKATPERQLNDVTTRYFAKNDLNPNFVYTVSSGQLINKGSVHDIVTKSTLQNNYIKKDTLNGNKLYLSQGSGTSLSLTDVTNGYMKKTDVSLNYLSKEVVDRDYIKKSKIDPTKYVYTGEGVDPSGLGIAKGTAPTDPNPKPTEPKPTDPNPKPTEPKPIDPTPSETPLDQWIEIKNPVPKPINEPPKIQKGLGDCINIGTLHQCNTISLFTGQTMKILDAINMLSPSGDKVTQEQLDHALANPDDYDWVLMVGSRKQVHNFYDSVHVTNWNGESTDGSRPLQLKQKGSKSAATIVYDDNPSRDSLPIGNWGFTLNFDSEKKEIRLDSHHKNSEDNSFGAIRALAFIKKPTQSTQTSRSSHPVVSAF